MQADEFGRWLSEAGLPVSEHMVGILAEYERLLVAEAKVQNLIGPGTLDDVWGKHFADSALGMVALDNASVPRGTLGPGARVVDIGSGAGLPGIPLKILWPDLQACLLEPRQKRAAFLHKVIDSLGLAGVEVLAQRAEDAAHLPGYRETFDLATVRAVSELPVLVEYGLPFLRTGGRLICYKGPSVDAELPGAALVCSQLGGVLDSVHDYRLPQGAGRRTLVLFRKTGPTPTKFPRKAGIPEKRPLTAKTQS